MITEILLGFTSTLTCGLLIVVILRLNAMYDQERSYWETWKLNKEKESK